MESKTDFWGIFPLRISAGETVEKPCFLILSKVRVSRLRAVHSSVKAEFWGGVPIFW